MSSPSPARRAACRALLDVTTGRLDSASAVARARAELDDERDRALAAEIVLGTLRWQGALDAALAAVASRPLSDLDLPVLVVLRLSAYQLLRLSRVPARAVVHDAVALTRLAGRPRAAGFVNAVLRHLDPAAARAAWPPPPEAAAGRDAAAVRDAAVDHLVRTLSHPAWLARRWLERLGLEAAIAWARFDNTPAPLTLRVNRLRTSAEALAAELAAHGVRVEPARWAPDALVVVEGQPLQTPLAGRGLFVAMDEGSQLVGLLAASLGRGGPALDACAAPGGKTIILAAADPPPGLLVACDLRPRRLERLRATLREAGASAVRVVRADVEAGVPFQPAFDLVLVDAPCSGLGTIRREPEIRWRRTPDDLPRLAAAQRRLLAGAASAVRPGGHLVYATCSSEPEENEEVVAAFLAARPDFRRLEPRAHPFAGTPRAALLDAAGDLRTLPHLHQLEGFYAAVLVRAG
jgi:16S rRNA (cytosine967-C5)-methyltransferase